MAKKKNSGMSIGKEIRAAMSGGISKNEFRGIANSTGASSQQIVQRMDAMNQNNKNVALNSGAANMLIKQSQKALTPGAATAARIFGNRGQETYGTGNIGKSLQGMMGSVGTAAPRSPNDSGSMGGSQAATPGTGLMIGGTQIRPGGRVAVRQTGTTTASKDLTGTDSQNSKLTGDTDASSQSPYSGGDASTPGTTPDDQTDSGIGMLSGGGMGAAGASKLGRAKSRLRKLGIYGRGTSLLGRGLQYGNTFNK